MAIVQATMGDATPGDVDAIFEINAAALPGVSLLTPEYFERLLEVCALFRLIEVAEQIVGYLCALDRHASYNGEEFQWYREHFHEDFLYIDQVAIGRDYRGAGLGRALYDDLEKYATRSQIDTLACEVNLRPVNADSRAFHKRCGFVEVGRMETRDVVVSLLAKRGLI